jgi:tRNA nucleotidyltransferase (CCA-adding enzyme)
VGAAPPPTPPPLRRLAERLRAAGGRAYLVGGSVRDHLMGLPVKDWDVEVFGLPVDALRRVLEAEGRVNAVGRSFGVLKWRAPGLADEVDVSVPRRDSKVGPGHRGIAVEGDPTMSLAEATRRRDLTINALMWDLSADALVDLQGGADDLAAGRLRAVDADTFLEDPLRALRVVQFAARLGFAPDGALVALCRRAPLDELPAERILGEWEKLLLRGGQLAHGFAVARATDVLARLFPEVEAVEPGPALERVCPLRDRTEPVGRRLALMLTAWLHPAPAAAVVATLDRLGVHTREGYRVRERVLEACAALPHPATTDADLRWLSTRGEPWLVLGVRGDLDALARAEHLGIAVAPPPRLLAGRHLAALGMRGGPDMGRVLDEAWSEQLDGALTTEDEAVAWARRRLATAG